MDLYHFLTTLEIDVETENLSAQQKVILLNGILDAAGLLHELGLQMESPMETVKRYVQANPDINVWLRERFGNLTPDFLSRVNTKPNRQEPPKFFQGARIKR